MPPLLAAHSGLFTEPEAVAELSDGGLVATRQLDPLVKRLIDIVTEPDMVASIEAHDAVTRTQRTKLTTIWRRGNAAVLGQIIGGRDFD